MDRESAERMLTQERAIRGVLDDGTRILFRHLRPDDKDRLRRAFDELSPESRYRRFFRHIDHLSDKELRYLTELDFVNHYAWAAVLDEEGEPGVGVARWIRVADDPTLGEGAVTVVDRWQGRGIGKTLLWLAARSAIERGLRGIRVQTLSDNAPILALLRELDAPPGRWESGILELTLPLPESVDHLDLSRLPLLLRAAASGDVVAEADPHEIARARLLDAATSSSPSPEESPP